MPESGRLSGLPALIDNRSRILILGSFPSVKSLETGRYYGNPLNHFWQLVGVARASTPPPYDNHPARCEWILAQGLAIWDTIATCIRPGSLDQNIRDIRTNDIAGLLSAWSNIRRIVLNGGSAARFFDRLIAQSLTDRELEICRVPSSSPIPSREFRRVEDKQSAWSAALR